MMPLLGGSGITLTAYDFGLASPNLLSRAQAPVAVEAAVAVEPGRLQSPGSPIHPRTSASPEAAEAAGPEAEAALQFRRRSDIAHLGRSADALPERRTSGACFVHRSGCLLRGG